MKNKQHINKKELEKFVNHEIDWLRYYGWRESREKLTIECGQKKIGYDKSNLRKL